MIKKTIGGVIKNVVGGAFNRTLGRLMGSGISMDNRMVQARAKWSGRRDKKDWRVRLQVPAGSPLEQFFDFANNPILNPLTESRGMFWPLTPMMQIQHIAYYDALAMTHSNMPHQSYVNSQVDAMNTPFTEALKAQWFDMRKASMPLQRFCKIYENSLTVVLGEENVKLLKK